MKDKLSDNCPKADGCRWIASCDSGMIPLSAHCQMDNDRFAISSERVMDAIARMEATTGYQEFKQAEAEVNKLTCTPADAIIDNRELSYPTLAGESEV